MQYYDTLLLSRVATTVYNNIYYSFDTTPHNNITTSTADKSYYTLQVPTNIRIHS